MIEITRKEANKLKGQGVEFQDTSGQNLLLIGQEVLLIQNDKEEINAYFLDS